ncbi:4809_t:CDS:2 [Entrophospora sp. SA101]|nr:4809_t:CDS:2 [Entrophospora sp. SA101]
MNGTAIRDILNDVPHNEFWNGHHLILDRDNGWLVENGHMNSQEFEELINNCHSNSSIELPIELKVILKELHQTKMTVKTLREKQLSMFKELNTDDILFYQKKWILTTLDNWLDYIELSSTNPLIKENSEGYKSASIYYSLIDQLALHYFHTLQSASSSESSLFLLHKIDPSLCGRQPDIYFCDDVLNDVKRNVEIAKDNMVEDACKYNLDTNKSLRENIYEINYAYDNLPSSYKSKIFDMDFTSFVISDNLSWDDKF